METFESKLNLYVRFSEEWFTKFVLVWCSISFLVGIFSVDDIALVIAAPLMTTFMYFASIAIVMLVIGFQQINPANSSKSNFVKYAIIFVWVFGVYGFMNFLVSGIFQAMEFENSNYFLIVASVFPLGASMGAAKQWIKFNEVD